jgi:hypothetical protein
MNSNNSLMFAIFTLTLLSCNQKKVYITFYKLEEREYFVSLQNPNFPPLPKDSMGNFYINLIGIDTLYTSTKLSELASHATRYKFLNKTSKYFETNSIEQFGYKIIETNPSSVYNNEDTAREEGMRFIIQKIRSSHNIKRDRRNAPILSIPCSANTTGL